MSECTFCRGDLIRILTKLLRRKSKLDHIIIETTGLADPGPVIQTFFTGTCFCCLSLFCTNHQVSPKIRYKKAECGVKHIMNKHNR